jgi:hypothetical protein
MSVTVVAHDERFVDFEVESHKRDVMLRQKC